MNVLLLGAGASKSYSQSNTNEKMPIAKDFFKTYNKLDISSNRWILVGDIINYLEKYHNIPSQEFITYDQDIEILHSEVEDKLNIILENKLDIFLDRENHLVYKTYQQLIFIFCSVINEIQNGPISIAHIKLAKLLCKDDIIITFNWDTLMDRALKHTTTWNSDNGYYVSPVKIYRDKWINKTNCKKDYPYILKLHGSTNWLTGLFRPDGDKLKSMQETPIDEFYIYENTINPYSTYDGRFMSGYSEFSYGYYPPNLPLKGEKIKDGYVPMSIKIKAADMPKGTASSKGLLSMPLIIPPVKHKSYSSFGSIFTNLWEKAEDSLTNADRIILIGYSFPQTDIQTDILFKTAFSKRNVIPEIIILDPNPEAIKSRFMLDYGIPESQITVHKSFFTDKYEVNKLFE